MRGELAEQVTFEPDDSFSQGCLGHFEQHAHTALEFFDSSHVYVSCREGAGRRENEGEEAIIRTRLSDSHAGYGIEILVQSPPALGHSISLVSYTCIFCARMGTDRAGSEIYQASRSCTLGVHMC